MEKQPFILSFLTQVLMSLVDDARAGIITDEMKQVARQEEVTEEFVRRGVAGALAGDAARQAVNRTRATAALRSDMCGLQGYSAGALD